MENPRNTPRLETPRLILRGFVPEDAPALWELLRDREVNRFLPWFPVETLAEAEKFLRERFLDTYRTETGWRYAVCLREEPERPVGYVNIAPGEAHDLGYGLEKACWHRGLMTEAARAVVEQVRRDGGLPFLTATHDVLNPRSGGVMQNIGMTYRYTYRERVEPKKEWVGVPVLSAEPDRTGGLCVEGLLGEPPHPLDRGHRRVIFHSGGSLVWKKAGCAEQE